MTDLHTHRATKDEWFRDSPDSPIPGWHREQFSALSYFDEDPGLRFQVVPDRADGAEVTIETSDDRTRVYRRAVTASVEIGGTTVTVALYQTGHGGGWFLPFRDSTSGSETYGAGRYIDVDPPASDGTVTIDFNLAYNPYCAYSDRFSCPLPPGENWLSVPVRAGEKVYRA
jgi:hypothetical protein